MDEEGDIADGPNGPIIFQGGRWVPYNGAPAQPRLTPLTPGRSPSPQTQAQAQKDQLDVQNAAARPGMTRFDQASKLRDDYNRDPSVRAYTIALPYYASALNSAPDPAGDLLLINSFAKVMDPDSVVREGEAQTVARSDSWISQQIATLRNQLNRTGSISPEQRTSLRSELRNRMNQLNAGFSAAFQKYRGMAERNGLDPMDVTGDYPGTTYADLDRNFWEGQGFRASDAEQPQQAPEAPRETVERSSRFEAPPGVYEAGKGPPSLAEGPEVRFSTETDKQYAAALRKAFADGVPTMEQLNALTPPGYPPLPQGEWQRNIERRRKGRSVNIGTPESGVERRTATQQAATAFLGSEPGAAAIGFANGATLGTFDELAAAGMTLGNDDDYAANLERANTMKQLVREEHPYWFAGGEIGGSMVPGGLAAKGATKLGLVQSGRTFSPGAIGVDTGLGAIYGAGEDNANRSGGALSGALTAAGGGIAGRGAFRQAGRMVAPTGGDAAQLYAAGVRPTPGQRVGGLVGRMEEGLAATPIFGGLVRGARQGARDQFETGAFNQALREIGKELPPEAPFGTEAHKFTQEAFDRAYSKARKRMQFVRDAEFDSDLQAILADARAGGLSEEALGRLERTIAAQVDRRAPQGIMNGDAFKKAQIALNSRVSRTRNSPAGDQELGDALESLSGALDRAARRNSPPKSVAALDAADAGYAKLVRIEEAAKRRGEAGRFTPGQFDAAVQNAAGGRAARSKAFLRGEALMQDYATAGRALEDTVSNPGTMDKIGATIASPFTIPATLPYGLHRLTGGLMAPRTGPMGPALNNAGGWLTRMAPLGGDILRQLTVQKNMENQRRGQ